MLDSTFRAFLKKPLAYLVFFIPDSVSPNHLTVLGFVFGISSCVFVLEKYYLSGLVLFWVSRLLDGLDGSLARFRLKQSDFGGYLDILLDFTVYGFIPLAFSFSNREAFATGMILETSFYVNSAGLLYLSGILAKKPDINPEKAQIHSLALPKGLVEAFETYVIYSLFYLFPGKLVSNQFYFPKIHSIFKNILFSLMAIGVWLTIIQRLYWAFKFTSTS